MTAGFKPKHQRLVLVVLALAALALVFNADTAAILIAFILGALIHLNLIPHIGW